MPVPKPGTKEEGRIIIFIGDVHFYDFLCISKIFEYFSVHFPRLKIPLFSVSLKRIWYITNLCLIIDEYNKKRPEYERCNQIEHKRPDLIKSYVKHKDLLCGISLVQFHKQFQFPSFLRFSYMCHCHLQFNQLYSFDRQVLQFHLSFISFIRYTFLLIFILCFCQISFPCLCFNFIWL